MSDIIERLNRVATGPALDLAPATWEPPSHVFSDYGIYARWGDEDVDFTDVYALPWGTRNAPSRPLVEVGDLRITPDDAEVLARRLLSAAALAREAAK